MRKAVLDIGAIEQFALTFLYSICRYLSHKLGMTKGINRYYVR